MKNISKIITAVGAGVVLAGAAAIPAHATHSPAKPVCPGPVVIDTGGDSGLRIHRTSQTSFCIYTYKPASDHAYSKSGGLGRVRVDSGWYSKQARVGKPATVSLKVGECTDYFSGILEPHGEGGTSERFCNTPF